MKMQTMTGAAGGALYGRGKVFDVLILCGLVGNVWIVPVSIELESGSDIRNATQSDFLVRRSSSTRDKSVTSETMEANIFNIRNE